MLNFFAISLSSVLILMQQELNFCQLLIPHCIQSGYIREDGHLCETSKH